MPKKVSPIRLRPREKVKILIAFSVSIGFLCVFYLTSYITPDSIPVSLDQMTITSVRTNILTLETGNKIDNKVKTILEVNEKRYESKIAENISVYDFMSKLENEGKINFKAKNYSGMGKLIEEINKVKNGGEKNWIYYVNGKKAEIGVSNYKIKEGDVVSWKYENSL